MKTLSLSHVFASLLSVTLLSACPGAATVGEPATTTRTTGTPGISSANGYLTLVTVTAAVAPTIEGAQEPHSRPDTQQDDQGASGPSGAQGPNGSSGASASTTVFGWNQYSAGNFVPNFYTLDTATGAYSAVTTNTSNQTTILWMQESAGNFIFSADNFNGITGSGTYLVNESTGAMTTLSATAGVVAIFGSSAVYAQTDDTSGITDLYLYDLTTSTSTQLTTMTSNQSIEQVQIGSDYIVYDYLTAGSSQDNLEAYNVSTGVTTTLTSPTSGSCNRLAVSGTSMLCDADNDVDQTSDVYLIDIAANVTTTVASDPWSGVSNAWSNLVDGSVVYSHYVYDSTSNTSTTTLMSYNVANQVTSTLATMPANSYINDMVVSGSTVVFTAGVWDSNLPYLVIYDTVAASTTVVPVAVGQNDQLLLSEGPASL